MEGCRTVGMLESHLRLPYSADVPPRTLKHWSSMVQLSFEQLPKTPEHQSTSNITAKRINSAPRNPQYKISLGSISVDDVQKEALAFKLPLRPSTLPRARNSSLRDVLTSGNIVGPQRKVSKLPIVQTIASIAPQDTGLPPKPLPTEPTSAVLPSKCIEPNSPFFNGNPHFASGLSTVRYAASTNAPNPTKMEGPSTASDKTPDDGRQLATSLPSPPESPEIIVHPPTAEKSASDDGPLSKQVDENADDVESNQYWLQAHGQYRDQHGFLWDKAIQILAEHFLHPANLSQAEFVSLVCAYNGVEPMWLHYNCPSIVKRTVDKWYQAHHVLVEAGISPCELTGPALDEFEFMDEAEQVLFIESYKHIERRVLVAEKTLPFKVEQRRALEMMSILEKFEYITCFQALQEHQRTRSEEEMNNIAYAMIPNSHASRIKALKAEKRETFKVLQAKLHEMKLIERSIRDLEEEGSWDVTSLQHPGDRSEESDHSGLPSYQASQSHRKQQEAAVNPNNFTIIRTAPIHRTRVELDDPFVEFSPIHDHSTCGTLYHEYAHPDIVVPRLRRESSISSLDITAGGQTERDGLPVQYYGGVEYQDYLDDLWDCYEESIIATVGNTQNCRSVPLSTVQDITDPFRVNEVTLPQEPTAVDREASSAGHEEIDESISCQGCKSLDNVFTEPAQVMLERAQKLAKELLDIANDLEKMLEASPDNTSVYKNALEAERLRLKKDAAIIVEVARNVSVFCDINPRLPNDGIRLSAPNEKLSMGAVKLLSTINSQQTVPNTPEENNTTELRKNHKTLDNCAVEPTLPVSPRAEEPSTDVYFFNIALHKHLKANPNSTCASIYKNVVESERKRLKERSTISLPKIPENVAQNPPENADGFRTDLLLFGAPLEIQLGTNPNHPTLNKDITVSEQLKSNRGCDDCHMPDLRQDFNWAISDRFSSPWDHNSNYEAKVVSKKPSMATITSESSTTSDKITMKTVRSGTPDVVQEAVNNTFARSLHVEFSEPCPRTRQLESVETARHSYEYGKEEVLTTDLTRSSSLRKKMSKFFGSIKRKDLAQRRGSLASLTRISSFQRKPIPKTYI